MWIDTEGSTFDGVNLKISTDGGMNYAIVDLVTPAYPLTIAGEPAWGGHQSGLGWQLMEADLSAYAGQVVRLRFASERLLRDVPRRLHRRLLRPMRATSVRRPRTIHRQVFAAFALFGVSAAWWGCAEATSPVQATTTGEGGSSLTLSTTSTTGTGGAGGDGSITATGSGGSGGEVCTSTSEKAEAVPVDLVFVIDRSGSMSGVKWSGTTSALTTFFNDPVSTGISAGIVYFPTVKAFGIACDVEFYKVLDVPVAELPGNAFALTNSMPANPTGSNTPMYAALDGALRAATAYQDAHPTHKVNVVLATDGDPNAVRDGDDRRCRGWPRARATTTASSPTSSAWKARSSRTSTRSRARAGRRRPTTSPRTSTSSPRRWPRSARAVLGCEFEIPPPPGGMELVPDEVNFTYTAGRAGHAEVTLLRADDLADCGDAARLVLRQQPLSDEDHGLPRVLRHGAE
jgi:hypothetical protein